MSNPKRQTSNSKQQIIIMKLRGLWFLSNNKKCLLKKLSFASGIQKWSRIYFARHYTISDCWKAYNCPLIYYISMMTAPTNSLFMLQNEGFIHISKFCVMILWTMKPARKQNIERGWGDEKEEMYKIRKECGTLRGISANSSGRDHFQNIKTESTRLSKGPVKCITPILVILSRCFVFFWQIIRIPPHNSLKIPENLFFRLTRV